MIICVGPALSIKACCEIGGESASGMASNLLSVLLCRYSNTQQSLLCREARFLQAYLGFAFLHHGPCGAGDAAG